MTQFDHRLTDLSRYIYGTTRLGDGAIPFEDRVTIARKAIDAGLWLHTSDAYGDALQVLNAAFDRDRNHIAPAIFKIGWDSVEQVRETIGKNARPVGLDGMAIGQLCLGGALAEEFRVGGPCYEGLNALKEEGLVGRYVLEMWPWTSQVAIDAIQSENAGRLVDAVIFYLNPLQRFVTNELWDLILSTGFPIVAMRTTCGGSIQKLLTDDCAPEYLKKRATEISPVFDKSGCKTWTEFCVRFTLGFPQVRATVGATSRPENFDELLTAVSLATPLPENTQSEILALQRTWSDEHDRFAAPWSM